MIRRPPRSTLFSLHDALPISGHALPGVHRDRPEGGERDEHHLRGLADAEPEGDQRDPGEDGDALDRKSTRLNSSHANISYAVFCLKKKIKTILRMPSYA